MRQKNIKNYYQKVSILSGIIALTVMQSAQANVEKIDSNFITAIASSYVYDNRSPSKTLDGMSVTNTSSQNVPEDWRYRGYATYGENANWTSNSGTVDDQWIIFDLGSVYSVATMNVANFDAVSDNLRDRGLQQGDIYYSDGTISNFDSSYNPNFNNSAHWTLLGTGSQTFNQTPDDNNNGGTHSFQQIQLNATARYIAIDVNSNYGDASYVGLNEVQFFKTNIPEPTSTAIILMTTVLSLGLRRRCNFS